jgi:hypothetical protein
MILCTLSPADLFLIMLSSKAGRAAADSPAVWHYLLSRDYPPDNTVSPRHAPHPADPCPDPKRSYRLAAESAAVYVAGGCSPALAAVSEVHRYALGPRRLARFPRLAAPRVFAAVARLGDRLYVLGGCTSLASCLRRCAPPPRRPPLPPSPTLFESRFVPEVREGVPGARVRRSRAVVSSRPILLPSPFRLVIFRSDRMITARPPHSSRSR